MGMVKEFKDFAMRGNVVDMAVGIVIGAAFGDIVKQLVEKIISPITGFLTGGVDFSKKVYQFQVPEAMKQALGDKAVPVEIGWGAFVQAIINFLIVAFALFMVIKAMNTLKKKEEAAPAPPSDEVVLLREIRDALKK